MHAPDPGRPARFLDRRSPPHILTLVLLSGMGALSMNLFLPSLPGMARHFGVDYAVMQLAVSAYLAMSALLQFLVGPITDRYGRRPVILGCLVIFLLATLGTLIAPSAGVFLVFRLLQAVIATLIALSRAVVRDMRPGPEAASMIGYVTMGMSLAPMIGPMIGGALDEAFGWKASFIALFACATLVLALAWADLGETARPAASSFMAQLRAYPALVASRRFRGYTLAACFASGGFFAYLGGAPFVGAEVFHLSPAQSGWYFACPAVGYALGNYLSGRFALRLGMDRAILIGAVLASLAMGLALLAELAGMAHPLLFFPAVGLMAMGNGIALPSANAGLMSVRPELAGSASGLGGMLTIGIGAGLATLAGALLSVETGATPLILVMLAASAAGLPTIWWLRARAGAEPA